MSRYSQQLCIFHSFNLVLLEDYSSSTYFGKCSGEYNLHCSLSMLHSTLSDMHSWHGEFELLVRRPWLSIYGGLSA